MPRTVPVFKPVFSRRRVLAGAAAVAVLGITGSACRSQPATPSVDELESQLKLARHDSELATAAAAGAPQPVGAALTQVASERAKHAQALATEIARVAGTPTSTSSETTSRTPTSPPQPGGVPAPRGSTPTAAAQPASLSDVVNSLRASAAGAGRLATTSSAYRAGLLGSIAAACTAAYTVALVFGESAP